MNHASTARVQPGQKRITAFNHILTSLVIVAFLYTPLILSSFALPTALLAQACTTEIEPNDTLDQATALSTVGCFSGNSNNGDFDIFRVTVDPASAQKKWDLQANMTSGGTAELCLLNAGGDFAQCREGSQPVLPDLQLVPGEYDFSFRSRKGNTDYSISFTETGEASLASEAEPNDTVETAAPMGDSLTVTGRLVGEESDVYRFVVNQQAKAYRVEVEGKGISSIAKIDIAGNQLLQRKAKPNRPLVLDDLYLLPGSHYVRLNGADGDYTLRIVQVDQPVDEREPNDSELQATPLLINQTLSGRLNTVEDSDLYHFSLGVYSHLRLTITPPDKGELNIGLLGYVREGRHEVGQPYVFDAFLPAGDYFVSLGARKISNKPYTILLEQLNPFEALVDIEPLNNSAATAGEIPSNFVVNGRTGVNSDSEDWYRLPSTQTARWINAQVAGKNVNLAFFHNGEKLPDIKLDLKKKIINGPLPEVPLDSIQVQVLAKGDYSIVFWFDGGPQPLDSEPLPIELELELPTETVQAYATIGQQIDAFLTVINTSSETQAVDIEIASSNHAWSAQLAETSTVLAGGESRSIPVTIHVLDMAATGTVHLYAAAIALGGNRVTNQWILSADCNSELANPNPEWTTAGELSAGLNVAWSALGATVVSNIEDAVQLFDNQVGPQSGLNTRLDAAPIVVDLAGEDPVMINGVLLNPLGKLIAPDTLRHFMVDVSLDGTQFTNVLHGKLSPALIEQPFVFEQPVQAKFVRLVMLNSHKLEFQNDIGLGEFKVIAVPGHTPFIAGFNLADPTKGGHVVYSTPLLTDPKAILSEAPEQMMVERGNATQIEWVIGFEHNRAAQITELQWVNSAQSDPSQHIKVVDLYVSTDGPTGPWQSVTTWAIDPISQDAQSFILNAPVWARFLRFVAQPPTDARVAYPETLRVIERVTGNDYRSILAEWGQDRQQALYELQQSELMVNVVNVEDEDNGTNNTQQNAQMLDTQRPIFGAIGGSQDEDWYQIKVSGANTLKITVEGASVQAELFDTQGTAVVPTLTFQGSQTQISAAVKPGTYTLRLASPNRSLLFVWDTTRTSAPYIAALARSLDTLTKTLDPQRDAINLLPFGKPGALLLTEWSSDGAALQTALTNYDRTDYANQTERNLMVAANALTQRPGAQTIILLSDAQGNSYQDTAMLWQKFAWVAPRVVSLQLNSGDATAQDHMQDWATLNQGRYASINSVEQFETQVAATLCGWGKPASYRLYAETLNVALPPSPTPAPTAQAPIVVPPTSTKLISATSTTNPTNVTNTTLSTASVDTSVSSEPATQPQASQPDFPGNPALLSIVGTTPDGAFTAPVRNGSVEIIFDASGSMMKTIDDRYRIDIARDVLSDLVVNVLDPDMPLAMRIFGQREARSCRTDLEVPLARLDTTNAAGVIAGVWPKEFSRTAIAASLALVTQDMADAQGTKVIVLVTDGEETCDGDPAAEIKKLVDAGIGVRVNIVGFAVGDEATKQMFSEWANLGRGFYFDATNATELSNAIDKALQVPFRVYTADGTLVTSGIVNGGRVEVPTGEYNIVVETESEQRFENVLLIGGEATQLEILGQE